jgi:hypothetical protein
MASLNRASLMREYTVDVYCPSTITMVVVLASGTLELCLHQCFLDWLLKHVNLKQKQGYSKGADSLTAT